MNIERIKDLRVPGILTATALLVGAAACGSQESVTSNESNATTTTVEADGTQNGSDEQIAAEAQNGAFKCGAELNQGDWDVNFEPRLLLMENNQDLLASKTEVLKDKVGEDAFELLVNSGYDNSSADEDYLTHEEGYIRLLAGGVVSEVQNPNYPTRENYRCEDVDGDGVGDKSIFRDIRSNEGASLLGKYYSLDEWDAIIAAAYVQGIDINSVLINQRETRIVLDEEGKEVEVTVVIAFFEDESCGNQVFAHIPEESVDTTLPVTTTPGTNPTTTNRPSPSTTNPGPTTTGVTTTIPGTTTSTTTPDSTTSTTIGPKVDDGKLPDTGTPADQDQGTPDVPGSGPAGQPVGEDGYTDNETPVASQPQATTTTKPAVTTTTVKLPPATTGTAPSSTNAPVTAPNNPTPSNPETGPLPAQP